MAKLPVSQLIKLAEKDAAKDAATETAKQAKIKAYHGTPHDFDEFSTESIGTGEGAQAYGRGLYFAEREGTAQSYRDALSARRPNPTYLGRGYDKLDGPEYRALAAIEKEIKYNKDLTAEQAKDQAIASLKLRTQRASETIDPERKAAVLSEYAEDMDVLQSMDSSEIKMGGSMYEVEIDASPDELIDFDAPLGEQKTLLNKLDEKYGDHEIVLQQLGVDLRDNPSGVHLIDALGMRRGDQKDAPQILKDIGIKGIQYADALTRFSPGQKTKNYVVFDDNLITISKKYGIPIGILGGMAKGLVGGSALVGGISAAEDANAGVLTAALSPVLRKNLTKLVQGEELTKAEERVVLKYVKKVKTTDDPWGARERMRMSEMETEDVPVLQRPLVDPQEMVGSILIPVMGDPSIAGSAVRASKGVEGVPLDADVQLFGGPNYGLESMYRQQPAAWESMYRAAATKQEHFLRGLQENPGAEVYGVYTMMGQTSLKFNTYTSELALRQLSALKLNASDVDQFNTELRKVVPDFAGLENPEAMMQVMGTIPATKANGDVLSAGDFRKTLITLMQKKKYTKKGFPVIEDIERIQTEPYLRNLELGASGFSIFRAIPEADLIQNSRVKAYDTGIPGHYFGGMQYNLPASMMFPRLWARTAAAIDKNGDSLSFSQQVGQLRGKTQDSWYEVADQQWADTISKYTEAENVRVQKIAKGTVAAGTVIASPFTFAQDNNDAAYLNVRQQADLTPGQIRSQQIDARKAEERASKKSGTPESQANLGFIYDPESRSMRPRTEQDPAPSLVFRAIQDVVAGTSEIPEQAVYGAVDAVGEVVQAFGADGDFQFSEEQYEPQTVTGGLARGITQFMVGFIPAVKGLKYAGMGAGLARTMIASAVADATVFDPQGGRLADLANQYPALQGPLTDFMATDPNDSEALGRFKNALEGLAIGGVADGFVKAVRLIKSRDTIKGIAEDAGVTPSELIDETIDDAKLLDGSGVESKAMVRLRAQQETYQESVPLEEPEAEFIPFEELAAEENVGFVFPEFKSGRGDAPDEAAQNINLNYLDSTEEIDALITRVAENDAPIINEARRQKVFNVDLPKLADDLGMTVDDLLSRPKGMAFNAEQILASRKILVASAENLVRLGKKAHGVEGTELDLAIMRRAMTQHRAIQAQVAGMTAEASRAFQQFKVVAESSLLQAKAVKDMLSANGGDGLNRDIARMLAELDDPAKVGSFVKNIHDATKFDIAYEVWINGLLSGLGTHVVNFVGNSLTIGTAVGERYIAAGISQAPRFVGKGGGEVTFREANNQAAGIAMGAIDGMRLAWQALKTGEPADVLQKMELENHRSLTGEQLNISGVTGRAFDYIGEMVRIPGRLLTASDEFFKAVGYRMELNAQAFRQIHQEGLEGAVAGARYQEIIKNPPENIQIAAINAARYQTFTNNLKDLQLQSVGNLGRAAETARNQTGIFGGLVKVVIPFVRTPTNIMSYTLERTPLALISRNVRADIAAGGARKDLALAKIATGSMIMMGASMLAQSGSITGAGHPDYKIRKLQEKSGWQPYSVLIGDTYYAYNRLDPIGSLLGIAADATYIMNNSSEQDAAELSVAISLALTQNMANKTYTSGVFEFMDAFFAPPTDEELVSKKLLNYMARMGGSMIPFSSFVGSIERQISPEVSATYDLMDRIKSRTPGLSGDLPPRRDVFGEIVYASGGLGPDFMAAVRTKDVKEDLVAEEMVRQEVSMSMPRMYFEGVDLTPEQYDRYMVLSSGDGLKGAKPLRIELQKLINSSAYRSYSNGPEGDKTQAIRMVFRSYRRAAKDQLIAEDVSLQQAIRNINFTNASESAY
jgi:hypothetical protein|tara:strand:+ start:11637 stop:17135 length:5499 start_codon:yes stop_codon:yes gene_type:complete